MYIIIHGIFVVWSLRSYRMNVSQATAARDEPSTGLYSPITGGRGGSSAVATIACVYALLIGAMLITANPILVSSNEIDIQQIVVLLKPSYIYSWFVKCSMTSVHRCCLRWAMLNFKTKNACCVRLLSLATESSL